MREARKPSWQRKQTVPLWFAVLALSLLVFLPSSGAQASLDAEGHQWWQHAVFYEIYPRSFADSNNDDIGGLNGICRKA